MPQLIRVPIADARHQTGISEGAGESAILMPMVAIYEVRDHH